MLYRLGLGQEPTEAEPSSLVLPRSLVKKIVRRFGSFRIVLGSETPLRGRFRLVSGSGVDDFASQIGARFKML